MSNKFLTVKDMALIAVFTALITVCSWISVPIGPIPFTLQTFAIFTTAGLLGTKRSLITVCVYILLGLIGVPVFSQFKAGPTVLTGPTGGYIIGFIFTVIIIGIITRLAAKRENPVRSIMIIASMIVGDVACFATGTVYFMFIMKMDFISSLSLCVFPYIIPDLIKMLIALIIVDRVKKYI